MYVNTNMILTNTSNTYNNSKGSFVSTQYQNNKNNHNKLNSNDDIVCLEFEDSLNEK